MRLARGALAIGAVFLAGALLGNVGAMREGAGFLRDESASVDGALAALPLVAKRVGADFQPDPARRRRSARAAYLDAVRDLGSDAPSPRALPGMYERGRARADESLRRALSPRPTPSAAAPPGPRRRSTSSSRQRRRRRARARPRRRRAARRLADVVVPPGGLLLRPVADSFTVSLRRFSDVYGKPIATVPAGGGQVLLQLPPDASPVPWHARLAFGGAVRACARG